MDWTLIQQILAFIQHTISCIGVLIIFFGVLIALWQFISHLLSLNSIDKDFKINKIRLDLGRILILGLEFIVAADLIGTTTTPDYYSLGILAIIVAIRTLLSYSLTREMSVIKNGDPS